MMKSRFLHRDYARRQRPFHHQLLAQLENMLALGRAAPRLANALLQNAPMSNLVEALGGFVDLPRFAPAKRSRLPPVVSRRALSGAGDPARTVLIVEDTFTASFEGELVEAASDVMRTLGYSVYRLPPRPNGKALHVLGLRGRFAAITRRRIAEASGYAKTGASLVGLDSATALMFEQEYREFTSTHVQVMGLETVLTRDIAAGRLPVRPSRGERAYRLLSHCTEQALRPQSAAAWKATLGHFGIAAEPVRTGCCGMAGMFGHEREHQAISQRLFELSWRDALGPDPKAALATGFSCRCQTKRLAGYRPHHPIEVLRQAICGGA